MLETVVAAIEKVAVAHANEPALRANERTWTYRELMDDSATLAGGLRRHGLPVGGTVALVGGNRAEIAIAWLAAARAGAVVATVNPTSPEYVQRVLGALAPDVLVHVPDPTAGNTHGTDGINIRVAGSDTTWQELMMDLSPLALPRPAPGDLLEVAFTSGTTGEPKAAAFTHAAHVYSRQAWIDHMGLTPDDVVYTVLPLFHAAGLRNSLMAAWMSGACCYLAEAFNPATFWSDVTSAGATFFIFHEAQATALLKEAPGTQDTSHRVRLACGAAHVEVAATFESRFGFRTLQNYGLTETGTVTAPPVDLSAERLSELRLGEPFGMYVGLPLGSRTDVIVLGPDGQQVPDGTAGQLVARSDGMFSGYYGDETATSLTLSDGWVKSGDLGLRRPDGSLYFYGRMTDCLVVGTRVVPASELEKFALRVNGISDAAIMLEQDESGAQVLNVIVVPEAASSTTTEDVRAALAQTPHADAFASASVISAPSIARNAMGRVDRAAALVTVRALARSRSTSERKRE